MLLENYLSGYDCAEIREAEAGYDYFGFTRSDGSWRILRQKTDGTEIRLAIGESDFETNFVSRSGLSYKTSNHLPRL